MILNTSLLSYLLLYATAFSLWIPGFSLLNVSNAWGLQSTLVFTVLLSLLAIIKLLYCSSKTKKLYKKKAVDIQKRSTAYHLFFSMSALVCTVFTTIDLNKSVQSFATEIVGCFFSFAITWWLCQDKKYFKTFIRGFREAGLLFSLYAIYQSIGLSSNLPFSFVEMNNLSFSLMDKPMAQYLGRSFGFTPEPSILASLLFPLVGISFLNLAICRTTVNYLILFINLLAFISTGSQSIVILPFFLIILLISSLFMNLKINRIRFFDIMFLGVTLSFLLYLVTGNEAITSSISRVNSSEENVSGQMRFSDVMASLKMLSIHPFLGVGVGASGEWMRLVSSDNSINSGGITSGIFRSIAEQGLFGALNFILGFVLIKPKDLKSFNSTNSEELVLSQYALSFALGGLLALTFFVGYRSVYSLWLIIPMAFSLRFYGTYSSKSRVTDNFVNS